MKSWDLGLNTMRSLYTILSKGERDMIGFVSENLQLTAVGKMTLERQEEKERGGIHCKAFSGVLAR